MYTKSLFVLMVVIAMAFCDSDENNGTIDENGDNKICQIEKDIMSLRAQIASQDATIAKQSVRIVETRLNNYKMDKEVSSLKEQLLNQQHNLDLLENGRDATTGGRSKEFHSCPSGYIQHERSCYRIHHDVFSWPEAYHKNDDLKILKPNSKLKNYCMTNKKLKKACNGLMIRRLFCKAFDSHLVIVDTVEEYDFLMKTALEVQGSYVGTAYWIAASDGANEGEWIWANTNQTFNMRWGPRQPNQGVGANCACLWQNFKYEIADEPCRSTYNFICEIELADG